MKPVSARLPVSAISRSRPTDALDLVALGRRPLVVPEDRRAQRAQPLVEQHEPVHLPREADAGGVGNAQRRQWPTRPPPTSSSGSCSAWPGDGMLTG